MMNIIIHLHCLLACMLIPHAISTPFSSPFYGQQQQSANYRRFAFPVNAKRPNNYRNADPQLYSGQPVYYRSTAPSYGQPYYYRTFRPEDYPAYRQPYYQSPSYRQRYYQYPTYRQPYYQYPSYRQRYYQYPTYRQPYYQYPSYRQRYYQYPTYRQPYYQYPTYRQRYQYPTYRQPYYYRTFAPQDYPYYRQNYYEYPSYRQPYYQFPTYRQPYYYKTYEPQLVALPQQQYNTPALQPRLVPDMSTLARLPIDSINAIMGVVTGVPAKEPAPIAISKRSSDVDSVLPYYKAGNWRMWPMPRRGD